MDQLGRIKIRPDHARMHVQPRSDEFRADISFKPPIIVYEIFLK